MDGIALAELVLRAAGRETTPPDQTMPGLEPVAENPEKKKAANGKGPANPDVGDAAAGLLSLLVTQPEGEAEGQASVQVKEEQATEGERDSPAEDEKETRIVEATTPNKAKGPKGRPASPLLAVCFKCKTNHRTVAFCRQQALP